MRDRLIALSVFLLPLSVLLAGSVLLLSGQTIPHPSAPVTFSGGGTGAGTGTCTAGSVVTALGSTGPTCTAVATSLIGESDGTSTAAGATTVASFAISGLTIKDRLHISITHSSAGNTTVTPIIQNSTDTLTLMVLAQQGNITTGLFTIEDFTFGVDQLSATRVIGVGLSSAPDNSTTQGLLGAAGITYKLTTVTTPWTSAWTLALRHGGVNTGGTYHYSIAVYKWAGQ